jgi:uncharacterized protein
MKKHILVSLLFLGVCCIQQSTAVQSQKDYTPFPSPDVGYVTDYANLLTADHKNEVQNWLRTVDQRKGIKIAVVTISSIDDYPGAPTESIEQFAKALFDTYGIGKLPENKGVLLLVAVKDRTARIELGAGYGHARDDDAERIMQKVLIPQFAKDAYGKGIVRGVRALTLEFAGERFIPAWVKPTILIVAILVFLIVVSLLRSGKEGWGWKTISGGRTVTINFYESFTDTVSDFSGSGGSDGGSSSGGGSSGGGGATGKW